MTDKALKILIVDDDVDFLIQTEVNLKNAGYRVIKAQGQSEAEKILETETPDAAILDLMMEEMDGGFALAYHIKRKNPDIPVIIVSGVQNETGLQFDATTDEEKAWIKADTFIAKPIRFEQLLGELERLTGK